MPQRLWQPIQIRDGVLKMIDTYSGFCIYFGKISAMKQRDLDAVSAAKRDFLVEIANTADVLLEVQQLRYQVFCAERSIFSIRSDNLIEADEYDLTSRHVVIRNRRNGEVVGTVRLVLTCAERGTSTLPMQRYCDPSVFRDLPMQSTAEISRFALSKQRRSTNCPSDSLLRLGLMQGILQVSRELKLTHWCAVMERSLLRLLGGAGVHFAPVGPMVEIFGLRQPSIAEIGSVLTRGKRQCPDLYAFITEGISRRQEPARELLVA